LEAFWVLWFAFAARARHRLQLPKKPLRRLRAQWRENFVSRSSLVDGCYAFHGGL
jgi:hypothetical protein